MNLLIQRDGQQFGPYTLDEARALLADGNLLPTDLAQPDGATDWKPLSTLPGFSTPPALPANAARRRRRMPLPISIGLCLLGLLVVTFLIWRIHLASQINARLAAIKAAGYPVNAAELDAWYEAVPEKENAALIVMQAIELLKARDPNQENADNQILRQLSPSTSLPALLKERFSQRVETNRAALALLHQAATRSKNRYPIDCSLGDLTPLPHLGPIKSFAYRLQYEAILHSEINDPTGTAESIQTGLTLGRSLKTEPVLMSQLVRFACDSVTIIGLQRCLHKTVFTDTQLAALSTALNASDDPATMSRALAGERASCMEYFRPSQKVREAATPTADPSEQSSDENKYKKVRALLGWTGFFDRDMRFWLTSMETNITVAALPAPDNLAFANLVTAQVMEMKKNYYIQSGLLIPAWRRTTLLAAESSARLRTAETAMAIERYRLAHQNQLPDSLAALVPAYLKAVPTDPFDGQPLRYQRREKGYVVYSLGPDLEDDDGTEFQKNAKGKIISTTPLDITFTVER